MRMGLPGQLWPSPQAAPCLALSTFLAEGRRISRLSRERPRGEADRDGARGPRSPNFALSGPANSASSCEHHFADSRPPALGLLRGLCSGAPGRHLSVDPTLPSNPRGARVVLSGLLLHALPLPLCAHGLNPSNSVPLGSHL